MASPNEQLMFPKTNTKKAKAKQNREEIERQKKFKKEVLQADNHTCQDPFCNHEGLEGCIIEAHHLRGRRYTNVNNGICFCRVAHHKSEEGFYDTDGYWVPGRNYEIKILEWLEQFSKNFRHQEVLDIFRQTSRSSRITDRRTKF